MPHMSETNETASADQSDRRGSPAPGCCILTTIIGVFGGLIALYIGIGIVQLRAFGGFTQDAPVAVDIAFPDQTPIAKAQAKLQQIADAVKTGKAERVLFTTVDLNALISSLDEAKGFRGNTRIEEITEDGLTVRMSQAMRKGPFQKGYRYLNGNFTLQPELRARTIAFKVIDIHPDVGELPSNFITGYAALDLFRLDPEIPALQANVPSLAAVYTEKSQLVVETKTNETPPESKVIAP